ncbi:MAG TPA: DUF4932 domain-containing protein [Pyrinomonadaceae bacterium]|nr:DUF4932 domain-containing protein [Pyrinomonadaceae bacterium]
MKLVITFILALFAVTANGVVYAQDKLPVIRSTSSIVSIQDGDQYRPNIWRLVPEIKPDVYESQLKDGKPQRVTFITDLESISFWVELGKKYDFIIQRGDDLCYTQIVGVKYVPAAVFDQKYQAANRGKMSVEIPEVYELVNIAIAMTPIGIEDRSLVYKESEYYKRMREWFDKYSEHPLLAALESELRQDLGRYFSLKMNGYAFEFDARGRIVQSRIYDRTGFRTDASNTLRPFLPLLQEFSDATNFREFYKQNASTYQEQIAFYRDVANIAEMKKWLDKNFPGQNGYDTYKIIFSPLVAYNQSTTWFESNGFRELQPHVNFPYPQDVSRSYEPGTEAGQNVFRGNIVFTEINHGYINPEAEKYAERILKAISNRERWVDRGRGPGYYAGIGTFNEYMNWGLVSLRLLDYAPKDEQARMIASVERMMTMRRSFPMFAEFNKFLVNLYRTRPAGVTIADLYPQIIAWFERNNRQPAGM